MFYEIYETRNRIRDTIQASTAKEAAMRYCQATGSKDIIKVSPFHYVGGEKYKAGKSMFFKII